jgi:hypothetical protein
MGGLANGIRFNKVGGKIILKDLAGFLVFVPEVNQAAFRLGAGQCFENMQIIRVVTLGDVIHYVSGNQ